MVNEAGACRQELVGVGGYHLSALQNDRFVLPVDVVVGRLEPQAW